MRRVGVIVVAVAWIAALAGCATDRQSMGLATTAGAERDVGADAGIPRDEVPPQSEDGTADAGVRFEDSVDVGAGPEMQDVAALADIVPDADGGTAGADGTPAEDVTLVPPEDSASGIDVSPDEAEAGVDALGPVVPEDLGPLDVTAVVDDTSPTDVEMALGEAVPIVDTADAELDVEPALSDVDGDPGLPPEDASTEGDSPTGPSDVFPSPDDVTVALPLEDVAVADADAGLAEELTDIVPMLDSETTTTPSDVSGDLGSDVGTVYEPPVLDFPECATAGSTAPCWRFRRTLWSDDYTNETLPVGDDWSPYYSTPRAPTAATLTFDGRVLAVGGETASWFGLLEYMMTVFEFDANGEETAVRYTHVSLGPVDCITVLDSTTYLLSEAYYVDWRKLGATDPLGIFDLIEGDLIDKALQTCPAAAREPGWIIAAAGGLVHKQVYPWKGNKAPVYYYYPGGSRTPVVGEPWTWTAVNTYDVSIYDLDCTASGCTGNYQGSGTSGGEPIPDELALDSNSYAVVGTTGHRLWVAGFVGDVMQPPGSFAATAVVGAGNIAYLGSTNGYLYAISTDQPFKGLQWQTDTGSPIRSAATLSSNGLLYVANEAPSLLAVHQATGVIQWKISLPGRPAQRSYPLTTEGYLYVTAGMELIALQVEPGGLAAAPWPKTGFDNHLRYNQTLDPDTPQY